MKKNKIIGALVGAFGVVVSVGTAIALYTKPVNNLELGIGSATHTSSTSTVTYKINNAVSPKVDPEYYTSGAKHNSGQALGYQNENGTYVCAKYEYTLGAGFADDIQEQMYVVGNISVSLENIVSSLQGKVQVSIYFDGYGDNTLGKDYYGSNLTTGSDNPETPANEEVSINNYVLTGSSLSVNARDICVASNGIQKLVVYFELLDTVDYLSMAELSNLWSLSVTWGGPEDFNPAYIANTKTGFEEDDEFVMAPNINRASADGWEWIGQIKGTNDVTYAKCRQGSNWQQGENAALTLGTIYDVTWRGGNDGEYTANFAPRS